MSTRQTVRLMMTGKMGSGKSSASEYLREAHGATCWSRTETMKALAHALAFQSGDVDEILGSLLSDPDSLERARRNLLAYAAVYEPEPGKPRRLYQDVVQILLDEDPLCFERELLARMEEAEAGSRTEFSLVDDVRNREALRFFAERGYRSLRIDADDAICRRRMLDRDGYLPDESAFAHPSERELDAEPHEFRIVNDSDDWVALHEALDVVVAQIRQPTH